MLRNEKMFAALKKEGNGLEIGPSYDPIAPKREGFNVKVMDHASQQELQEKYKSEGVDVNNIEFVDYVWRGESYKELVGNERFDWIIASHVIEHVPDLVQFINSCSEVLKDDGVLSLAVPDARYCFDQFRPPSGLSNVIDTHLSGATRHSAGTILEAELNASTRDGRVAWGSGHKGENKFLCSPEVAVDKFKRAQSSEDYVDAHKWCFTPSSFRLILSDLKMLGLTEMREVSFFGTEGCEFILALSRQSLPGHVVPDRLQLSEAAQKEMAEPFIISKPKARMKSRFEKWKRSIRKRLHA